MSEPHLYEPSPADRWDEALRAPLAEINEDVFGVLVAEIASLRAPWQSLGEAGRRRLLCCPYLLLEGGFSRPDLWAGLPRSAVSDVRVGAAPASPAAAGSPGALPTALVRRVLHFAWHLARTDPRAARLVLGMSRTCTQMFVGCRLAELEIFAELQPAWIRIRWANCAGLWSAWISAAAHGRTRDLERLQLWGLQMLAADSLALPRHSPGRRSPMPAPALAINLR